MKYQLLYNIEMSLFITSGTITANFKQNIVTIYAYSTEEEYGGYVKEFYLKTEQPLPFEVEYTYTTYYTEWDDRYDPPQEVNHEQSTTATLVSGKLESTHKTHNSGSTGGDNNSGTYVTFTINNKKCNAGEIFIINGKQYLIKCMTI